MAQLRCIVLWVLFAGACRSPATDAVEQAGGGSCAVMVATDGNDISGLGTLSSPFATLDKARDMVRGLVPTAGAPLNVCLRGGTYQLAHTFVLKPEDSGTATAPITYMSYPGERAIVSGGVKLTGLTWQQYSKNIYVTPVDRNFNQLFVDGVRRTRARSPNYDGSLVNSFYRLVPITGGDYTATTRSFQYCPSGSTRGTAFCPGSDQLPAGLNNPDIEVVSMEIWGQARQRVASTDDSVLKVRGEAWANYGCDSTGTDRYYIENTLSAVDAPGEWFLDENAHLLYYQPIALSELSTAEFTVPRLHQLVRGGDYRQNAGWDYIGAGEYPGAGSSNMVRGACRHLGVYPDDPTALDYGSSSFTVAGWLQFPTDASVDPGWVFSKGNPLGDARAPSGVGYGLQTSSTSATVPVVFNMSDGVKVVSASAGAAPRGTWVHAAFIVDRTAGTLTAYANGVPTSTAALGSLGSVASNLPFDVGAYTNVSCSQSGVDNLVVYGRALSSSEVGALAADGTPSSAQLDLYLKFDGDFSDSSPRGSDTQPFYPPYFTTRSTARDAVSFQTPTSTQAYDTAGPVDYIGFTNIDFEYTDWAIPYTGYVGDNFGRGPSAVYLHGHYATVSYNGFYHLGNGALGGMLGTSTIDYNTINDVGGSGIAIGELSTGDADLTTVAEYTSNDTIYGNYISDIGLVAGDQNAIQLMQGANTQILNNRITRTPAAGIAVWGNNSDLLPPTIGNDHIAYNDVSFVMQLLNDGSGIYVNNFQSGTMIDHNIVYDIGRNATGLEPHTSYWGLWGIYLDGNTAGVTARDNLVYRTGHANILVNIGSHDNLVTNNIFVDGTTFELAYCSTNANRAYGNIFYDGQSLSVCPDLFYPGCLSTSVLPMIQSDDNLFYFSSLSCKSQLWSDLGTWSALFGYEMSSLRQDPQFVDYTHDDFTLKSSSPAISGIGFVPIDFTGVPHTGP
jgi:hypothetical protein